MADVTARPARAAVLIWDWRAQPDLGDLGRAITELSTGDTVHLHQIETQSDDHAIVLATVQLDEEIAFAVFHRWWTSADPFDTSAFELETEVPRG